MIAAFVVFFATIVVFAFVWPAGVTVLVVFVVLSALIVFLAPVVVLAFVRPLRRAVLMPLVVVAALVVFATFIVVLAFIRAFAFGEDVLPGKQGAPYQGYKGIAEDTT